MRQLASKEIQLCNTYRYYKSRQPNLDFGTGPITQLQALLPYNELELILIQSKSEPRARSSAVYVHCHKVPHNSVWLSTI
jgi:hypothetical protein